MPARLLTCAVSRSAGADENVQAKPSQTKSSLVSRRLTVAVLPLPLRLTGGSDLVGDHVAGLDQRTRPLGKDGSRCPSAHRGPGLPGCSRLVATRRAVLRIPGAEVNKREYERFEARRDDLETRFGGPLEFQPLPGRKALQDRRHCPSLVDVLDRDHHAELSAWFLSH